MGFSRYINYFRARQAGTRRVGARDSMSRRGVQKTRSAGCAGVRGARPRAWSWGRAAAPGGSCCGRGTPGLSAPPASGRDDTSRPIPLPTLRPPSRYTPALGSLEPPFLSCSLCSPPSFPASSALVLGFPAVIKKAPFGILSISDAPQPCSCAPASSLSSNCSSSRLLLPPALPRTAPRVPDLPINLARPGLRQPGYTSTSMRSLCPRRTQRTEARPARTLGRKAGTRRAMIIPPISP